MGGITETRLRAVIQLIQGLHFDDLICSLVMAMACRCSAAATATLSLSLSGTRRRDVGSERDPRRTGPAWVTRCRLLLDDFSACAEIKSLFTVSSFCFLSSAPGIQPCLFRTRTRAASVPTRKPGLRRRGPGACFASGSRNVTVNLQSRPARNPLHLPLGASETSEPRGRPRCPRAGRFQSSEGFCGALLLPDSPPAFDPSLRPDGS